MMSVRGFAKTEKLAHSYHRLSNMQIQHMMKKCRKPRSAVPATQIAHRGGPQRRAQGPFFRKTAINLSILEESFVRMSTALRREHHFVKKVSSSEADLRSRLLK